MTYFKNECAVVSWFSSPFSSWIRNCLIQYQVATAQMIMKIQLMILAVNQEASSSLRKASIGRKRKSTNNDCIASKNALIVGEVFIFTMTKV